MYSFFLINRVFWPLSCLFPNYFVYRPLSAVYYHLSCFLSYVPPFSPVISFPDQCPPCLLSYHFSDLLPTCLPLILYTYLCAVRLPIHRVFCPVACFLLNYVVHWYVPPFSPVTHLLTCVLSVSPVIVFSKLCTDCHPSYFVHCPCPVCLPRYRLYWTMFHLSTLWYLPLTSEGSLSCHQLFLPLVWVLCGSQVFVFPNICASCLPC